MDKSQLINKFKHCGIIVEDLDGVLTFTPNKKSTIMYWLLAAVFLPVLWSFIFIMGPSIIGTSILLIGVSCLISGISTIRDIKAFNRCSMIIGSKVLVIGDNQYSMDSVFEFSSESTLNPFFINADLILMTEKGSQRVLKVTRKNRKYLNDDKYDLVSYLNDYLAYIRFNKE